MHFLSSKFAYYLILFFWNIISITENTWCRIENLKLIFINFDWTLSDISALTHLLQMRISRFLIVFGCVRHIILLNIFFSTCQFLGKWFIQLIIHFDRFARLRLVN